MTARSDLKRIIRTRQQKTGESYTTARVHVLRERAVRLGGEATTDDDVPVRAEAVVLKVNRQSARVRVLGEEDQITFRSCVWNVVPGHVVTLAFVRRWTWRGDAYASGHMESPRVDISRLDLEPLRLEEDGIVDLRASYQPYRDPDPYAPLWRKLTARPRPGFIMDPIAWGELPGQRPQENPTCDAAELAEDGDVEAAQDLLMEALSIDLRCLDAHAHLGNLAFASSPERAIQHYEIGIRIAELSLPPDFDGVFEWGRSVTNRPFLRCLHGHGLCQWRLGQLEAARRTFERILSFNPNDNQGVRFCWNDLRNGRSWEEMSRREEGAQSEQMASVRAWGRDR